MVRELIKKILPKSFLEERAIQLWYAEQRQKISTIETAIHHIETRWQLKPIDTPDRPIFIFAAEWRAGSTLLQRLVNSDRRVLIWGEPFHKGSFVPCLSDSLRSFTQHFPPSDYFIDSKNFAGDEKNLCHRWTANLYPELQSLINAQQTFYQTLYAQPALSQGFERWGIKEVRLTIEHAYYLKWLFPRAKFLFLYRNPYNAYQSCHTWRDLYVRWPDSPVPTPEIFGTLWSDMVQGYQAGFHKVDGMLIQYEQFCAGNPPISMVADHLELNLDPVVMTKKIGSRQSPPLSIQQVNRLRRKVEPLASQLGYTGF